MEIFFWPPENKENKYVENILRGLSFAGVENANKPQRTFVGKIFSAIGDVLNPEIRIYHFNWIENFSVERTLKAKIKIFLIGCLLRYGKVFGKKFVWTMHNTIPHKCKTESDVTTAKKFMRDWIGKMDMVVVHSTETKDILCDEYGYPDRQILYVPHGKYDRIDVTMEEQKRFRKRYGIQDNENVLLSFGLIDEYKNIPLLIRVFDELKLPNVKLMICGKYANNLSAESKEKIEKAKDVGSVIIVNRFIKDEEVPYILGCSNAVVLPYKKMSMQNSGVAILAMSYYKPIIVSKFGYINDICNFPFVYSYDYDSEETHGDVLKNEIKKFFDDYSSHTYKKSLSESEKNMWTMNLTGIIFVKKSRKAMKVWFKKNLLWRQCGG